MAQDQKEREPWEQQPGETSTAFAHFAAYRDMRYPKVTNSSGETITTSAVMDGTVPYEKRSLRKLAAAFGINFRAISRQSEAYGWVKRCEAYDAYVDRTIRESNEAAIRKMKQEHALLAQLMIRKATKRLIKMPMEQIGAADLVRMVDVAVKVERLSRGESTENQTMTHSGEVEVKKDASLDLSSLSNEELDQFEQLLEKINGAAGD